MVTELMTLATKVSDHAGWIPAVILPTAAILQIVKIVMTRSTAGVSVWAWGLFGVANLGVYFYSEKMMQPQAILAFLLTAVLNFVIVGMVISRRPKRKR